MNDVQKTTLVRAINHFGVEAQTEKALEEMGELITELSRRHSSRGDKEKIAEEVADALVMLEQLRIIYGGERVDGYVAQKLARLEEKINGDGKRQERMMPPGMVVHSVYIHSVGAESRDRVIKIDPIKIDPKMAEDFAKRISEMPVTLIPGDDAEGCYE